MATVAAVVSELTGKLSSKAKVLTDSAEEEFIVALERWTDIDKKTPGAIVFVATEEDVLSTVKTCLQYNVKFVAKAGGHSAWSTIGAEGIIIDLSNFKEATIDKDAQTVTFKEVQWEEISSFGSGNTVGIVPQALGGGLSAMSGICGSVSDNILSARLITAKGELLTVTDESHPELMYGLRGAGQHLALVTELTIQAYPISVLGGEGADYGSMWMATVIFPAARMGKVAQTLAPIAAKEDVPAAALGIVCTDPESGNTVALCLLFFMGSSEHALAHFDSVKQLGPMMFLDQRLQYTRMNDSMDPFCVKGGFKHFQLAGVPRFQADPKAWDEVVEVYAELVEKVPDAKGTGYGFEFSTGKHVNGKKFPASAWSHQNVKSWIECLSWHTNPEASNTVNSLEMKAIEIATRGFNPEGVERYQNFTREGSLEARYGNAERVAKLKALKAEWDPTGVFTHVFL